MLVKITGSNLREILREAVGILKKGGIIAYPTETFYGLGVRFDDEGSLRKLYELKKRPEEKPMPLIISSREMVSMVAEQVNDTAAILMDKFWPGPLTLILKAKKSLSRYLTADTGNAAVRIPGKSFALSLVEEAGFPITATSANLSGMPPADRVETVMEYFNEKLEMIIDGGKTPGGLPSTIVDVTGVDATILREGVIPALEIRKALPAHIV